MLIEPRVYYKPFKYPEAYGFFLKQQQAHWLWTEVNMGPDIKDYNENLTDDEKKVVIRILRLFTTIEIDAEEYWSSNVAKWFKHPEIQQMAATNGAFESIHIAAYDHLSTSLGLPMSEYAEFLKNPAMKAKKDKLSEILSDTETLEGKARSLAVFSAFTEGVSLFSSFAVLMNFSRFNKLKGVANIVSWSVRDEGLHSDAGCWLFRILIAENSQIWTDEFKKTIYQAAREVVELEDEYIDAVFADN
jgi:ribonucleoside-diphosphate reductase beta chain